MCFGNSMLESNMWTRINFKTKPLLVVGVVLIFSGFLYVEYYHSWSNEFEEEMELFDESEMKDLEDQFEEINVKANKPKRLKLHQEKVEKWRSKYKKDKMDMQAEILSELCDLSVSEGQTLVPKDAMFQTLKIHNSTNSYHYSAFYDTRVISHGVIRIFGLSPVVDEVFYCQVYYDEVVYSVKAKTAWFDYNPVEIAKKFQYKSQVWLCEAPLDEIPWSVAITKERCKAEVQNMLRVNVVKYIKEEKVPNSVLVCMNTLGNSTTPSRLIEFLEYQRIFGANHVNIYDVQGKIPSNDTVTIIRSYINKGFVSIQNWRVPETGKLKSTQTETMTGKTAQLNDCVYRNMHKYKYIIFLQPNQYIVPKNASIKNYMDLSKFALQKQNQTSPSLMFANADFCVPDKYTGLLTMQIQNRSVPDPWRSSDKTKYMVNPRKVNSVKLPSVQSFILKKYKHTAFVSPDIALMHTYKKVVPRSGTLCNVTDQSALRYRHQLQITVNKICQQLKIKSCTV